MRAALLRWFNPADAVRALGARPWALFAALLALNSLVMPYAGFIHDARLYGVQVLNRAEGGAYADDLFFRYGSQDKFSLFSTVVAPIVSVVGLEWTFFLLYLLSNALLALAMQRFIEALLKDRFVSTVALLFLAVTPIGFGGHGIFHVNENFLTPRLLAVALTLFGLERALQGRFKTAVILPVAGCLFHPLMAVGGVLAVVALWAWTRLPRRATLLLAALGLVATAAVLAIPPLGYRIFGRMDAEWLHQVRVASAYNFPLEWELSDWVQVVVSFAALAFAAYRLRREHAPAARLLVVLGLTAAGGFLCTLVASELGYVLLFQGQPYRVLWVLQLLHAPLLFDMAVRLWRRNEERGRVAAVALVAAVLTGLDPVYLLLPVAGFVILAIACRGLGRQPRRPDWLSRSLAGGLAAGLLGWMVFRQLVIVLWWNQFTPLIDGLDLCRGLLGTPGPLGWVLFALVLLAWLHRRPGFGAGFIAAAAVAGTLAQAGIFLLSNNTYYLEHYRRYYPDVQFVAGFLNDHREAGRTPAVYWSTGRIDDVWLRVRAKSYFTSLQVQGVLFSRDTASEGRRRALVVRRFEMEQMDQDRLLLPKKWIEQMQELYQLQLPGEPPTPEECEAIRPTQADLEALCREPAVDYAVVPHAFNLPCAATNGRFYIYDCRQVRAALDARSATVADADAPAGAGAVLASADIP